jgi:hypothetical protein
MRLYAIICLAISLGACQSNHESSQINQASAPRGVYYQYDNEEELFEAKSWQRDQFKLDSSLQGITHAPVEFDVDTEHDTILKTAGGILVHIPKRAFISEFGINARGKLKLVITEYNSPKQLFAERLSTRSAEDLLETGGTVKIQAFKNKKRLFVSDTSELVLMFPRVDQVAGMTTYLGQRDGNDIMDWRIENENSAAQENDSSAAPLTVPIASQNAWSNFGNRYFWRTDTVFDSTLVMDVVQYKSRSRKNPIIWKYAEDERSIWMMLNDALADSEVLNHSLVGRQKYKLGITYTINRNGNVNHLTMHDSSGIAPIDSFIDSFFWNMPALDPNLMGYLSPNDEFHLTFMAQRGFSIESKAIPSEEVEKRMAEFKEKAVSGIPQAEANYYIISTQSLGWVNCDRLIWTTQNRINFVMKLPNDKPSSVGMIFKRRQVYLAGRQVDNHIAFYGIPYGEDVVIFGVSNDGDELTFSQMELNVDGFDHKMSSFTSMNLSEIDSALTSVRF